MSIDPIKIKNDASKMGYHLYNTVSFIAEAKLWTGFFKYKSALILSLLAAMLIPYSIYKFLSQTITKVSSTPIQKFASIPDAFNWDLLFGGTNKYLLLILIQMLVVYFSNRTIEYLSSTKVEFTLSDMIHSQIRVIKVAIRNWFLELIFGIGISIIIGIVGPKWLGDVLKFAVGCYFVGFLFIDNYNFTFGLSIKESAPIVQQNMGAALVVGFVAKVLFLLPVVGSIFVSFICSVAATWYMHTGEYKKLAKDAFA